MNAPQGFVFGDVVTQANEDYFSEASAHDRAEKARKFEIAMRCLRDDGRKANAWERRWVREYNERKEGV